MSKVAALGWGTLVYLGVGLLLAIYPPIVSDKPLGRVCFITASVCLWLLWITCYMSQMNPMAYPDPQLPAEVIVPKE
ncbi:hypothetical protein RB653_005357 [Dictyostelium firmibasis]|uniref:Uncharacterized protein n=1 Tax=Dictyostelium firmibasis TaxID=79012 RepID=A0AAN7UKW0_9MYCE